MQDRVQDVSPNVVLDCVTLGLLFRLTGCKTIRIRGIARRIGYSKDTPDRMCEEQNDFHWQGGRWGGVWGPQSLHSPLTLPVEVVLFFPHPVRGIFGVPYYKLFMKSLLLLEDDDWRSNCHLPGEPNREEYLHVGDWVAFTPDPRGKGMLIGRVLKFHYITGKNKSYTLSYAPTSPPKGKVTRGVEEACNWYTANDFGELSRVHRDNHGSQLIEVTGSQLVALFVMDTLRRAYAWTLKHYLSFLKAGFCGFNILSFSFICRNIQKYN